MPRARQHGVVCFDLQGGEVIGEPELGDVVLPEGDQTRGEEKACRPPHSTATVSSKTKQKQKRGAALLKTRMQ